MKCARRQAIAWLLLGMAAGSCGQPQDRSGTNTNWLRACDEAAECGAGVTCVCGLCTTPCTETTDCAPGVCGSSLASAAQCAGADGGRICVPDDGCAEVVLVEDGDFGPAVTPACTAPGALVCESFDGPLPDAYATRYGSADTATATVQDCLVRQGDGALLIQAEGYDWVQNRIRLPTPVTAGLLHVRFYAYFASGYPIPEYFILLELWDQDDFTDQKISIEAVSEDRFRLVLGPNASSLHVADPGTVRRDEWMCLELALDVAASGGTATLLVDGAPLVEATDVVTLPPDPISVVAIEAVPSEDSVGTDVAIDELVVATEPIGCL